MKLLLCALDEAARQDFSMQYMWQLDQTLTIVIFFNAMDN